MPPIVYPVASRSTGIVSPASARASAASSAPSAFMLRSHQYQPSEPVSPMAVSPSPAATAPRIAA